MLDRKKLGLIVSEFTGTAILAMVAMGSARYFRFTAPWYIAIAAGLALVALVGMLGKISGAHLNPAITLAMWTLRKIPTLEAIVYIASQLLGGVIALAYIEYTTNTSVLASGLSAFDGRLFLAEIVGTAVFAFGFASAVYQKMQGIQLAFTIGISFTLGILVAAVAGPGFINPAIALANNSWDKTSVIAPLLGAIIGMNVYGYFLAPEKNLKPKPLRQK